MKQLERWLGNILYKRVRESHEGILNNQIHKGADKYENPLPGKWTAKQLIRHGKEENVDQFVYYEALEIVVEGMEDRIKQLTLALENAEDRAEEAKKRLIDQDNHFNKEMRKWANMGR